MFPAGQLAALAKIQLSAWEAIAADWPIYADEPCMRCVSCHISIYRTHDDEQRAYQYTPEQTLALIVAHLRQAHMSLDPDT